MRGLTNVLELKFGGGGGGGKGHGRPRQAARDRQDVGKAHGIISSPVISTWLRRDRRAFPPNEVSYRQMCMKLSLSSLSSRSRGFYSVARVTVSVYTRL